MHALLLQVAESGDHQTLVQWLNETNLVSFLIVLTFLYVVFTKLDLFGKVAGHGKKLASEIEAVEAQKQKAQADLDAIKKRVASLESEVDDIISNAKKSASGLSEQILKDARAHADKIVETAKSRVELEQRAAAKDLEKRLLSDALNDARAEMARNLTAADQKRSVETFISELADLKK